MRATRPPKPHLPPPSVYAELETMVDSLIDQLNPTDSSYGRAYRTTVLNLYVGFEGYFERLLYYEIEGLTLMAEGHNARNETAAVLTYISGTWQPMIRNQVNLFITQVERFVINAEVKAEMEFPNMGPIPSSDYDVLNRWWQDHYGNPVPSITEILPRADHFADVKLNGTGRFTARVLVFPQVTATGTTTKTTTDPKPVFNNTQSGTLIKPDGVQKTVYIRKNGAQTSLFCYLFDYDLGTQPVGQYLLVSPTAVNTVSPYTGWFNVDANLRYEWWSYHEGVKLSCGSYATLTHITVSSDIYGNPYGYWGGLWIDQNLS